MTSILCAIPASADKWHGPRTRGQTIVDSAGDDKAASFPARVGEGMR